MTRNQNKATPSEPTIIAEQHRNPEGPTQQKEKQTNLEKKPPVASDPTIIAEQKRKPTKKAQRALASVLDLAAALRLRVSAAFLAEAERCAGVL